MAIMSTVRIEGKNGEYYDIPVLESPDKAYNKGVEEGRALCSTKHYVEVIDGTGNGALTTSNPIPFEPDTVSIVCCTGIYGDDGETPLGDNIIHVFAYDRRAIVGIDTIAGVALLNYSGSSGTSQSYRTTTPFGSSGSEDGDAPRYVRNEDDTITIQNVVAKTVASGNTTVYNGVFGDGLKYIFTAVKC